jgi:hypothetical protein
MGILDERPTVLMELVSRRLDLARFEAGKIELELSIAVTSELRHGSTCTFRSAGQSAGIVSIGTSLLRIERNDYGLDPRRP